MTQSEWLASTDPQRMLDWLRGSNPLLPECPVPPPSDRKLRLFACACCRQVWDKCDSMLRAGVEHAEEDGYQESLRGAAVSWAREPDPGCTVPGVVRAALLRCIFGNPFRPVTFPCTRCWGQGEECWKCKGIGKQQEFPAYLKVWNGGTVPKIAASIYGGRLFDEMPILADALEEAGCDNEDMLMHCRGLGPCPGCGGAAGFQANSTWVPCEHCDEGEKKWLPLGCGHVRGCWALDLLLGKE